MELQAEAERRKRAQVLFFSCFQGQHGVTLCACALSAAHGGRQILESEGSKQSVINRAEGEKAEVILRSEAARTDAVNRATGARCCGAHMRSA
jgi:regulator of protease activity HflC (stomatin/prohibitin superfamily)